VQVLFRPEDVVLAPGADALAGPPLAQAEVEQITFAGSTQRVRLRLPPIPGLRAIAPAPAYGSESATIEAVLARPGCASRRAGRRRLRRAPHPRVTHPG
jgi:hypothetical protein